VRTRDKRDEDETTVETKKKERLPLPFMQKNAAVVVRLGPTPLFSRFHNHPYVAKKKLYLRGRLRQLHMEAAEKAVPEPAIRSIGTLELLEHSTQTLSPAWSCT
jgi:hypothetical protein